ncbi:MAG: type IV toxin-antitoxin system AbiEi family antitoxin domain-containing protein [Verrucomicrobia bacterium]|nr:type IV toxin-antitoxin system AbiEi family antitoxin domain-containing protein [Verrucomicrobiota bacterium]MCH8514044.1 type IV toxin-antitoxin system AbiEi family antitoxin domain-containing protein [Kiritimatiellia bacterium]
MTSEPTDRLQNARAIFLRHGGILRTRDALQEGIHPEILYRMRDLGHIQALSRGLYRLADQPEPGQPDLLTVCKRSPAAVICMISALAYHGITTQIPHAVDIALPRGSEPPRIQYPPVNIYWTVPHIFTQGIQEAPIDGHSLRIYSPERCIVDVFRHRNKLGLDTALEALRLYRERLPLQTDTLLRLARVCRVESILTPYLQSTL